MRRGSRGYPRSRRSSSRLWLLGGATAAVVGIAAAVFAASGNDANPSTRSDSQRASVAYLAWDGDRTSTAAFAGKPLVVNFWASWCTSCLAEIPRFVEVFERHRPDVQFLGLNLQDHPDAAESLRKELGISYALGRDPRGEAFQAFGGIAMPTTVLIDSNGQVVKRLDGEISAEQLEAEVRRLLEESA